MIKRRLTLVLFSLLSLLKGESQNFSSLPPLDNGIFPYYVERVISDTVHDKLIVSSKWMKYANGKVVRGVASWDGVQWDSLGSGLNTHDTMNFDPNSAVFCGTEYNGKLLAGGYFRSIGGVNATYLALWDGTSWDSLPVRAFKFEDYNACIYGFLKHNNLLYIYGQFDTIQGQKANSLAIFDGNSFQPVPLPFYQSAVITSMIEYNGELYIAGNFYTVPAPYYRDIYKFDGTNWSNVGGSLQGGVSSVGSMAVYNGELYVGGYFEKAAGNAGNVIMKWNGNNWSDAGWGNTLDNGGIWKLLVHHNKLFAFGTSEACADMYSPMSAVFDGTKWCAFKDTIDTHVYSATVFRDTIYIAGAFKKINSDTLKRYVAKLGDENSYRDCTPVGLKESEQQSFLNIYPNPVSDVLFLDAEENIKPFRIKITNVLGETVFDKPFIEKVDLSSFKPGVYILNIGHISKKIIKH